MRQTRCVPGRVLRVRGVRKRYGALRVLQGVDLDVHAGEVVALVGENGAGKSTLVHCVVDPEGADGGTVESTARVSVVWQDLALCDNLSAVANVFLGNERLSHRMLDEASMATDARRLLDRLGIALPNPLAPVATLSGGQRQLVAIARAVLSE